MSKFFKKMNYNDSNIDNKFLYVKLHDVLREYCKLRIQLKLGQFKKVHLFKKLRYEIACIKLRLFKK